MVALAGEEVEGAARVELSWARLTSTCSTNQITKYYVPNTRLRQQRATTLTTTRIQLITDAIGPRMAADTRAFRSSTLSAGGSSSKTGPLRCRMLTWTIPTRRELYKSCWKSVKSRVVSLDLLLRAVTARQGQTSIGFHARSAHMNKTATHVGERWKKWQKMAIPGRSQVLIQRV